MINLQKCIKEWNSQADEYNQWEELDCDEKCEWCLKLANDQIIAINANKLARKILEKLWSPIFYNKYTIPGAYHISDGAIESITTTILQHLEDTYEM